MKNLSSRLILVALVTVLLGVGFGFSAPKQARADALGDFIQRITLGDFIRNLFGLPTRGGALPTPTPANKEPEPTNTPTQTPQNDRLTIGNRVFIDNNNDGIFEPELGESGIAGFVLSVSPVGFGSPTTVTTDANGEYLLTNLIPGRYFVKYCGTTGVNNQIVTTHRGSSVSFDPDTVPVALAGRDLDIVTTPALCGGEASDPYQLDDTSLFFDFGFVPIDFTVSPTPTPTSVPSPTQTPTPTPTISVTQSPTPTLTPTVVPTLPAGQNCYYNVRLINENGVVESSAMQTGVVSEQQCRTGGDFGGVESVPSYYNQRPGGTNNPGWPCTDPDFVVGDSCANEISGGKLICIAGPQHIIKGCYNPTTNQYQRISITQVVQPPPAATNTPIPPVPTDTPAPAYSSFAAWYSEFKSYITAGGGQVSLSALEEWRNDAPLPGPTR